MFTKLEVVYFIIWAIAIGLTFAFVYTNIQRTALSKFINALINGKIFTSESSAELSTLGISGIHTLIIKNAVNKHHGLKRIIGKISIEKNNDEISSVIFKKTEFKYYLEECNTEEILKKYSFKTMPKYQVILLALALLLTAFLVTKAADLFYDIVVIPKIQQEIDSSLSQSNKEDVPPKLDNDEENTQIGTDTTEIPEQTTPQIPTIPTIHTIPTLE